MKIVLIPAVFALARGNLHDQLEALSTSDADVSKDAACWCDKLKDALDTRSRETDSQLQYLRNDKNQAHFENEALKLQIAGHNAEVKEHEQSLDAGAAIESKAYASYQEEKSFHEAALKSVRKAMDAIPDGSGHEVMGALRGLEESFSDKLEEAQGQYENREQGLLDAKAEMVRLAKQSAATKSERLSDGETAVAQATTRIGLYEGKSTSDASLSTFVESLCTAITNGASERQGLWQDALVACSQAEAEKASAIAAQSMSKLIFLKRRSQLNRETIDRAGTVGFQESTEHTLEDSSDLEAILSRTDDVESKLLEMLHTVVSDTSSTTTDANLRSAVESLGKAATANAEAVPSLFDEVRAAGKKCMTIDKQILAEISSG